MTTKIDKHKFFNPNVNTLEPYVPGKQINDSEYLKLNTNENPFGPSPRVKETIVKFLENSESFKDSTPIKYEHEWSHALVSYDEFICFTHSKNSFFLISLARD